MTRKDRSSQIEGATQGATTSRKRVPGSKGATGGQVRRTRSPHPGVVLKTPTPPRTAWRARYTDPDSQKEAYESLDPLGAGRNAQTRRRWAIEKARAIAKRKDDLSSGAPRATGTAFGAALGRFYEDHPQLRARTLDIYQRATNKLVAWGAQNGLQSADDLTGPKLVAFRATLTKATRRVEQKGERRGAKRVTETLRKPNSVNIELRAIGTVLGYLRRLGLTPHLSMENIVDGLRKLPAAKEASDFLRTAEIKQLLQAARTHDAETYKSTRFEHAGHAPAGSTPKYDPIAPLITVALLTGMRFGELAALDWSEVDLEEGEIRLTSRTKTKTARTIDMAVSPALKTLLTSLHEVDAKGPVWSLTVEQIRSASKRLARYGGPEGWSFQALRRTCGTYLTNAPGIFGGSSAYRSARILGHSVQVAERHYLGVVKIDKEATTLEAAMGIDSCLSNR
jgi:integrase